ncbi:nucleotidyl transferase AbiEii/AbiGii toxin family protein [Candidatus Gottesmanbacteria bacterium]|nr:nucleotidyl transferase AbiEii/AbiGii toxin family protein [Candidatus Gottesmanbacteria bacterium]
MGYNILTPHQSQVVDAIQQRDEIIQWYTFTGGTALSEVYLQHRLSEDLDFFTQSQVMDHKINALIDEAKTEIGYESYEKRVYSGLYMYTLIFSDGDRLKLDFNEYDFPPVEHGTKLGKLSVDSLFDIAINKLEAILSRSKSRDFVDLYMMLPVIGCDIDQVRMRLADKFSGIRDDTEVVRHLTKVVDFSDYPTMLVSFDRQAMIDFYLKEAKKIGERIFR